MNKLEKYLEIQELILSLGSSNGHFNGTPQSLFSMKMYIKPGSFRNIIKEIEELLGLLPNEFFIYMAYYKEMERARILCKIFNAILEGRSLEVINEPVESKYRNRQSPNYYMLDKEVLENLKDENLILIGTSTKTTVDRLYPRRIFIKIL